MQKMVCGAIVCLVFLTGCCRFDKENKTFYGWGTYKDKDVEMSSNSPIKDMVNLSGLKL